MGEHGAKHRLHLRLRLRTVDTFVDSVCALAVDRTSEKFAKVNSLFLYELGNRMIIYAQHVGYLVFMYFISLALETNDPSEIGRDV